MTRARRRQLNKSKAIRKKKIADIWMLKDSTTGEVYPYYKHLNQYNKGKIHCSCPLCRRKTKSTHRGLGWEGSGRYDYKMSERKQQDRLDNSLYEYFLENSKDATEEETNNIKNYIKSISKNTGIDFFDYLDK